MGFKCLFFGHEPSRKLIDFNIEKWSYSYSHKSICENCNVVFEIKGNLSSVAIEYGEIRYKDGYDRHKIEQEIKTQYQSINAHAEEALKNTEIKNNKIVKNKK